MTFHSLGWEAEAIEMYQAWSKEEKLNKKEKLASWKRRGLPGSKKESEA